MQCLYRLSTRRRQQDVYCRDESVIVSGSTELYKLLAAGIAGSRKIADSYRTVCNVGPRAGQSVFHLHIHLLGGLGLAWPPG